MKTQPLTGFAVLCCFMALTSAFAHASILNPLSTMEIEPPDDLQTRSQGKLADEYDIYRSGADDGNGGDITNDGRPLTTFDEWLSR